MCDNIREQLFNVIIELKVTFVRLESVFGGNGRFNALAFALAIAVGYAFMKFKVPGGLLVGAMLVFALMQVLTDRMWIAPGTKEVAQIIAGCFIGASLSIEDVRRLPKLWKAFTVIVIGLILLNISIGLVIAQVSGISLITALFSTIPGGMSEHDSDY